MLSMAVYTHANNLGELSPTCSPSGGMYPEPFLKTFEH